MNYRIVGTKYEVTRSFTSKRVSCEVYRDSFEKACRAREKMKELGYRAEIRPTPEMWTQELEVAP
jgi:hypothetical protein